MVLLDSLQYLLETPWRDKKVPEKSLLMTSHFNSHITTDLKPEMLSHINTEDRIPHDEEMYVALHIKKGNIFLQLQIRASR